MSLKLKIGALTDVGLVRANNEDNFLTIPDLTVTATGSDPAQVYDLGKNGALMVVADGMGGMNAGEVASQIAINTVRDAFSPMRITPDVLKNKASIEQFMNQAIVEADAKIKAAAMRNPESQGMGTTIVLAWILADKLYVSWCGDSRAYVFNSAGLHQITKDHSYVQTLVDQGDITRDQAFDYPQSNVITRSLCDGMGPAEPEALFKPYPLANGDTVILCTDGVSGMLRDPELEQVIGSSPDDLDSLMDSIKAAVKDAGAADNLTMCIAQVVDGALPEPETAYFKTTEAMLDGRIPSATMPVGKKGATATKIPWKLIAIVAIVAIICAVAAAFIFGGSDKKDDSETTDKDQTQTEIITEAEDAQPVQAAQQPAASTPAKKPAKETQPKTEASEPAAENPGAGLVQQISESAEGKQGQETTNPNSPLSKISGITGGKKPEEPVTAPEEQEPAKTEPQQTPAPAGLTVPPPPAKPEKTETPENAVKGN